MRHISCYGHTLHLVVMNAMKETSLEEIKEKVSKIVKFMKKSLLASQKLKEIQLTLGSTRPKKLIQQVPMRWNSVYEMLERLFILKDAVSLMLTQVEVDEGIRTVSANE